MLFHILLCISALWTMYPSVATCSVQASPAQDVESLLLDLKPDLPLRRALLTHYHDRAGVSVDQDTLDSVSNLSEGSSIRDLKNMVDYASGSVKKPQQVDALDMIGTLPLKVSMLIKQLKDSPIRTRPLLGSLAAQRIRPTVLKNRMILYGPPGNGKTTLAQKIARETDSIFVKIDGPTIVDKYVGQGAQNIAQAFTQANTKAHAENKCAIIFVDEIDAIASNNKSEFRTEHAAALQQLWLELDRYKNDPYIFVIFATNHFTKLEKTFLDRFGGNAVEIPNPDVDLRNSLLTHYCTLANIAIDAATLNYIAKKADGLSIRCLEDLVSDVAAIASLENKAVTKELFVEELAKTRAKFDANVSDDDTEKRDKKWQRVATFVSIVGGVLGIALNTKTIVDMITHYYSRVGAESVGALASGIVA